VPRAERGVGADILGSTVALADISGRVTTFYTYEPFGNATSNGASTTNPSRTLAGPR
jgi:hypothetical protein